MKILIVILLFILSIKASEEIEYEKIFFYLEQNNIIVGKDISSEELYEIINKTKEIEDNNKSSLFIKIHSLINYKESQFEKIREDIDKNPNSKINQTVKSYLTENNKVVEEAREDIKKKDNDSWFSKSINYILELMKY